MKLPRWLTILMLTSSVLAVLVTAGWWWVTWPERTAREFAAGICEGRIDDVLKMSKPVYQETRGLISRCSTSEPFVMSPDSRTCKDIIHGRQRFELQGTETSYVLGVLVQRGIVRMVEYYDPTDF